MTKVYPKAADVSDLEGEKKASSSSSSAAAVVVQLTVWNKSLLPNCNGFTVFDGKGNLVFRVDNYIAAPNNKHQIVLMDAAGKPLLTIRHKRGISLGDNWVVFEGEDSSKPIFTARKHGGNTKCTLAQVFSYEEVAAGTYCGSNNNNKKNKKKKEVAYEMEGSYTQRCCTVYNTKNRKRKVAAEIKRKEAVAGSAGVAFGTDVFRLIVYPDMDTTLAMAFVILLDQMFR